MLWGGPANTRENFPIHKDAGFKTENIHILRSSLPSNMANAKNTRIMVEDKEVDAFIGCKHFAKCNEILEKAGLEPVNWSTDCTRQTKLFS